ncbi:MAG: FMN-binding protein, partial [Thermoanaerobaculia bacterium]|nr:FMN-binding protein [Thermoanaerobaculia bacterium]
ACGILIVLAFQGTKPVIERNRAEALNKAIFHVLPEARSSVTFRLEADGGFAPLTGKAGGAQVVHAGYAADGRLVGFAVQAQGMGYQDAIVVLYAYTPELDAVTGFRVLESRETPGLGDKIDFDPGFLANFERLSVELAADLSAVLHPIESVKHGEKTQPWQIDAITGATVSSVAVAKILRESTALWTPRIRQHLDDFRQGS